MSTVTIVTATLRCCVLDIASNTHAYTSKHHTNNINIIAIIIVPRRDHRRRTVFGAVCKEVSNSLLFVLFVHLLHCLLAILGKPVA